MKNRAIVWSKMLCFMMCLFALSLLMCRNNVYAASNPDLDDKAIASSIRNCTTSFKNGININDFISSTDSENAVRFVKKEGKGGGLNGSLPNNFNSGNCAQFLDAVMNKVGKSAKIDNAETAGTFLTDIGYKNNNNNSEGECVYFNYYINQNDSPNNATYSPTMALCAASIKDGIINVDKLEVVGDALTAKGGNADAVEFEVKKGSVTLDCATGNFTSKGDCGTHEFKKGETNWRDYVKAIQDDLLVNNQYKMRPLLGYTYYLDTANPTNYVSYGETKAVYDLEDDNVVKQKAVSYFLGKNYSDADLKFSKVEKFVVYQNYLKDFFGADVQCDWNETQITANTANGYKLINFYDGNSVRSCYAKGTRNESKSANGIDNNGSFGVDNCDFACVATWLADNKVDADALKNYNLNKTVGVSKATSEEADEEDICLNSKGAESLGWIVCPLLQWMSGAANDTYNDYVAPSLQIQPSLFTGEGDNVRTAWENFRDIANVIFIILFLFVIFSQLTGIGIDNYGIKKILPKLIVAAIMINLSYILCILLVDLSNILGSGLKGIFDSLGSQLNPVIDVSSDGGQLTTTPDLSGGLASVGVLAALGVMVGSIWANPAILLSLLVSALGVVVAIFFLFLLLAARKAAVIVLVVLSPLAVVAYMLPNTKKLFDRWWKFFEGLLLVYPIAGLFVGGGNYISRLLLGTSTGFFAALTAMMVGIVPLFFIPMVLKSSFAAMGKVGGMLAGMGTGASRAAKHQVRERGGEKSWQYR